MKERPILFSGPMVRALLAGTKTMTRRVVKAPVDFIGAGWKDGPDWNDPGSWGWEDPENPSHFLTLAREPSREDCSYPIACPYGVPGDRLWVREAFVSGYEADDSGYLITEDADGNELDERVWYRADCEDFRWYGDDGESVPVPWKPSIHMPRWASRLTLEITGVRVERVQEISEADAIAEGCDSADGFRELWGSINGDGAWDANPWVWVVVFRQVLGGNA